MFYFFSYGAVRIPLPRGKRCSFLFTKEKSQKKCATLQVDRRWIWELHHESPVPLRESPRERGTVHLPKAAARLRTARGSLGSRILPRHCASRGVPLSVISSPPSGAKGGRFVFLRGCTDKFLFGGLFHAGSRQGSPQGEALSNIAKQKFIFLTVQKKSAPYSQRASPVCAHTARRRERVMNSDAHPCDRQIETVRAAAKIPMHFFLA